MKSLSVGCATENLYCLFLLLFLFIVGDVDIILKLTMTSGWGCKFVFDFSLSSSFVCFFSLDQNAEVKQKLGASEKEKEVCCWEMTRYRLVY